MSSIDERLRRAAERADRPQAPAWTPNRDATHPRELGGVVVERSLKQNAGFESKQDVTIVTVREAGTEAEWSVWCFGAVLAGDLAPAPIGAVVFVRYEGRRSGGKGEAGYESYRVVVDAGEPAPAAPPVVPVADPDPIEVAAFEPAAPLEPEPELVVKEEPCVACGSPSGRHQPGCPERATEKCSECGFLGGHHRQGCGNDIPF